jgi:DNA-directed RNA polymerase subunit RPC12/RpoP
MNKGYRERIKNKNICDNWTLRNNPMIFLCSKCNKYNSIIKDQFFVNCNYCGNPNYIKK